MRNSIAPTPRQRRQKLDVQNFVAQVLQVHKSLYRKWLVHPRGQSHKEMDWQLNFSKKKKHRIRKFLKRCRKVEKCIAEK